MWKCQTNLTEIGIFYLLQDYHVYSCTFYWTGPTRVFRLPDLLPCFNDDLSISYQLYHHINARNPHHIIDAQINSHQISDLKFESQLSPPKNTIKS